MRPEGGEAKTVRVSYDPQGKKAGMQVVGADGKKRAEVRATPTDTSWRRSFTEPGEFSGDGLGGRLVDERGLNDSRRDILVVLAYDHFKNQRYAEAMPIFERLAEAHPDDVYVLSGAGACALRLERFELAMRWYDQVLERDPAHGPSLKGRDVVRAALGLA